MPRWCYVVLVCGLVALSALLAYPFVLQFCMRLVSWGPPPQWWVLGSKATSAVAWMQMQHTAGFVLASLPFALAYVSLIPRHAIQASVATALVFALPSVYGMFLYGGTMSTLHLASASIDLAKFAVTLPALACLLLILRRKTMSGRADR